MSWQQAFPLFIQPPDSRPIREIEQEIVDELQFHIEMRTLDNVKAGMPPAAARQDAVRRFGDFERIHKACRNTLLGERIMLQRVQAVLTVVLLGAVIFLGVVVYRGQRANEEATTQMMQVLNTVAQKTASSPQVDVVDAPPRSDAPRAACAMVVKTVPKSGDRNVDPSLTEIRVTYNQTMMDGSWSWSQISDDSFPETTGEPHYEADGKTCVLPVKLVPGKVYTILLNSDKFHNFKDAAGRPAGPYVLQFRTQPTADGSAGTPTVVQTVPRSGDSNVDPSLTEIRVTYNVEMLEGSWSWGHYNALAYPETTGEPHYEAGRKTCVLPVKLKPGTTYTIRLNSAEARDFKDKEGHPAIPYVLQFATRP